MQTDNPTVHSDPQNDSAPFFIGGGSGYIHSATCRAASHRLTWQWWAMGEDGDGGDEITCMAHRNRSEEPRDTIPVISIDPSHRRAFPPFHPPTIPPSRHPTILLPHPPTA